MSPRQVQVASAILVLLPMIFIVYSESELYPQVMFTSIYGALVIGETLALLSLAMLLVRLSSRSSFDPILGRGVRLAAPIKVLAMVVVVAGLSVFAFWVLVDLLSGYQSFPGHAFATHPFTVAIYNGIGLGALPLPDKDQAIGFTSLAAATVAFMVLRLGHDIRTAVRDGVSFFAAPVLVIFELALWYRVPLEMYWHATAVMPWSLGRFLTPAQFLNATYAPLTFVWGGNVYLLSNWFVLLAASGLFGLSAIPAWRRRHPNLEQASPDTDEVYEDLIPVAEPA